MIYFLKCLRGEDVLEMINKKVCSRDHEQPLDDLRKDFCRTERNMGGHRDQPSDMQIKWSFCDNDVGKKVKVTWAPKHVSSLCSVSFL